VLHALHEQLLLHNRCVAEYCRVAASELQELTWTTEDNIMGMQIGSLVVESGYKRSIVIKRQSVGNRIFSNELQFIDDGHPLYHTLAYPLLFPTGSPGWCVGMTRRVREELLMRNVSIHDYGRYTLMHREK
jgi:hypothetical protein